MTILFDNHLINTFETVKKFNHCTHFLAIMALKANTTTDPATHKLFKYLLDKYQWVFTDNKGIEDFRLELEARVASELGIGNMCWWMVEYCDGFVILHETYHHNLKAFAAPNEGTAIDYCVTVLKLNPNSIHT
jgi:hypothetical protein